MIDFEGNRAPSPRTLIPQSFKWSWRYAALALPVLVLIVLFRAPPSAYTYVSIQVNDGQNSGDAATGADATIAAAHSSATTACEYLGGGITSLTQLKSAGSNMCNMRQSDGEYTRGTWVRTCAVDASEYVGRQTDLAHYSSTWAPTPRWNTCFQSATDAHIKLKTEGLLFNYRPSMCNLLSFNSMLMADMLRRHKFYFVGDSLTEQFVNSVKALTGVEVLFNKSYILVNHKTLRPMEGDEYTRCFDSERARMAKFLSGNVQSTHKELTEALKEHGACAEAPDRYLFCMAETARGNKRNGMTLPEHPADCPTDEYRYSLKKEPAFAKQYHRSVMYQEWPLHLDGVDVLFLGTGHHWWKEEELARANAPKPKPPAAAGHEFGLYNDMIRGVFEYLAKHFKGRHIVFVATTQGHYECDKVTEVGKHVVDLGAQADKYKWKKAVDAQQEIARIVESVGLSDKFVLLNLTMSNGRPDHHPATDCLHWCEPGVPDTWVHLAYNLLVQLGYSDGAKLP